MQVRVVACGLENEQYFSIFEQHVHKHGESVQKAYVDDQINDR